MFVCTPAGANPDLLRAVRAPRGCGPPSSPPRDTARPERTGRRAQDDLVALADELGMLLAGPNGQGVVSTPASLCAQIVAPYPPPGRIGIASQSGNFVSSFQNWAAPDRRRREPRRCRRATRPRSVADYLDWYADDDATAVSLAYVEGVADGRALFERLRAVAARASRSCSSRAERPRAVNGPRRATPDRSRPTTRVRRACAARPASRARQPSRRRSKPRRRSRPSRCPRAAHVVVVTTAGGWGVVTADAIARDGARAAAASRRPAGRDRREAAAPLESQQPDRPRRRRDPRHGTAP